MSNTRYPPEETVPRTGRVTEVCQEWMVREDSALAYRLQNQEFTDHLSGNRSRNALVREDFPRAKNEQLKEQEMAEQAAAIYQRMLQEQEEHDEKVAKDLAEKLEREEKMKKRVIEMRDQDIARQMLERERIKVEKHQQMPPQSPSKPILPLPPRIPKEQSPHRPNPFNYQANLPPQLPKRQALPMPLPQENSITRLPTSDLININSAELYTEPYRPAIEELAIPLDDLKLRQIQEERDAELARKLQEEEGNIKDTILNRDRMLAIEAQDKELAKLLQERERAKAKRAKERAKQKALAKKQQETIPGQIMPDDSYALPADLISNIPKNMDIYNVPNPDEEDISYSLPADVIVDQAAGFSPKKTPEKILANRPTHLELKSPLTRFNKARMPDPESGDASSGGSLSGANSGGTSPMLSNIAMAIDPTYSRRGGNYRPPSSYDTTSSSTVTTSTSSSSPGLVLPPPEIDENDDDSPAPPYMPIQGQRRTASLEKKKKKSKEGGGCKQQ